VGRAVDWLGDRMLAGRSRWAWKCLRGVELHVVVEVLERFMGKTVGELLVDLLSNDCVSFRYAALLLAKVLQSGDWLATRGQRSDRHTRRYAAKCRINQQRCLSQRKPPFSSPSATDKTQPTGGDVVLKSSEATELECDGVSGGMPMNW
jgi:hypothetical protein